MEDKKQMVEDTKQTLELINSVLHLCPNVIRNKRDFLNLLEIIWQKPIFQTFINVCLMQNDFPICTSFRYMHIDMDFPRSLTTCRNVGQKLNLSLTLLFNLSFTFSLASFLFSHSRSIWTQISRILCILLWLIHPVHTLNRRKFFLILSKLPFQT